MRRWWQEKKALVQAQLLAGSYRFRELRRIRGKERVTEYWASLDARSVEGGGDCVDSSVATSSIFEVFSLGGSGSKGAVREVAAQIDENTFVFRTDVKGYYASINQEILLDMVRQYVPDAAVLELIGGYLRRVVADGGVYEEISQGIRWGVRCRR